MTMTHTREEMLALAEWLAGLSKPDRNIGVHLQSADRATIIHALRLAASASDGVQTRIPDDQQCNEQSGKQLSQPLDEAIRQVSNKLAQLIHYRDNNCQLEHARIIAVGRVMQAQQDLETLQRVGVLFRPVVANPDAVAPENVGLVSGVSSDPLVQPHESGGI